MWRFAKLVTLAIVAVVRAAPIARAASGPTETVLYHFHGHQDGAHPRGPLLVAANGSLYGTTFTTNGRGRPGAGTLFQLEPSRSGYTESVLHRFRARTSDDGALPVGRLLPDGSGALFGVTEYGGDENDGAVYEFSLQRVGAAKERVLHAFTSGADGFDANGDLLADAAGNLYGTTAYGGSGYSQCNRGCGTVFELRPTASGYAESILYAFQGGTDGYSPRGGLIADATGTLYGTTAFGGISTCRYGGCGTVFKLAPEPSGYRKTTLYNFQGGDADGDGPYGTLVADKTGAMYGVVGATFGMIFKLAPTGSSAYSERIIYLFRGLGDGAAPNGDLILDDNGDIYGTAQANSCASCGFGTAFELVPSSSGYREVTLHAFAGGSDGANPQAGLVLDNGVLYGTTGFGGTGCPAKGSPEFGPGCGTVFSITL